MIAHNPETCRCDHCSCERALSETGGWEWVQDTPERKTTARGPEWIVLDLAVLALALAIAWATLFG